MLGAFGYGDGLLLVEGLIEAYVVRHHGWGLRLPHPPRHFSPDAEMNTLQNVTAIWL